jgi:DNA repair protein RadC
MPESCFLLGFFGQVNFWANFGQVILVGHPREIFAKAIDDRTASIIVAHNHPSDSAEPSADDIEITRKLKKAGRLMGINVLEHIIVSKTEYRSI